MLVLVEGFAIAQQAHALIARKLAPDQIAEAQRMAREWLEKHQQ